LVVEENRIFGEAISAAIAEECSDLEVVATASSVAQVLGRLKSLHADVVLIGSLTGQSDAGVVDEVLAHYPSMALLLFGGLVGSAAGDAASGYRIGLVPKQATVEELCDAIHAAAADPPPA
jgi:DNA-binding NarL/FixJ family response regulator